MIQITRSGVIMKKDTDGRLHFKIVFFGASLSGKTTILKALHDTLDGIAKGKFTSIEDPSGRTLFFDYVPMSATEKIIFDIYTVAGQKRHGKQRKVVLQGADGILLVIDSTPEMLEDNIESVKELKELMGNKLGDEVPVVVCLNKRDVPSAMPRSELRNIVNLLGLENEPPIYETIALNGIGVKKAFQNLAREILIKKFYLT